MIPAGLRILLIKNILLKLRVPLTFSFDSYHRKSLEVVGGQAQPLVTGATLA